MSRSTGLRAATLMLALCWNAVAVHAQEAGATPPADGAVAAPQAPSAPVLVQQNTSGHTLEWVITAIGIGVALFAVCRSSQRN